MGGDNAKVIAWDAIHTLVESMEGTPTVRYRATRVAIEAGAIQGRIPDFSTFWRWLKREGLHHQRKVAGAARAQLPVSTDAPETQIGSLVQDARQRLADALVRLRSGVRMLCSVGLVDDDELRWYHNHLNKPNGKSKTRQCTSEQLHARAAQVERYAAIFEERVHLASVAAPSLVDPMPATGEDEARPVIEALSQVTAARSAVQSLLPGHPLPVNSEDPLFGVGSNSTFGQLAKAAPQPDYGTVVGHVHSDKTREDARLRLLLLGPVLTGDLSTRACAEYWRDRFATTVGKSGCEGVDGIPLQACQRYRSLTGRTVRSWYERHEEARRRAALEGKDFDPVDALVHTYPTATDRGEFPHKELEGKLLALLQDDPEYSTANAIDHLSLAGELTVSERTAYRIVERSSEIQRVIHRAGPAGMDEIFGCYPGRQVPYPNRVWLIDHSFFLQEVRSRSGKVPAPIDFGVCCVRSFPTKGGGLEYRLVRRLAMTIVQDMCTRNVLALRLWSGVPTTFMTLLALRDAILRYGVPEILYSDNGSDFRSREISNCLVDAGIRQTFSRPYTPRGRGINERTIGSIKTKVLPLIRKLYGSLLTFVDDRESAMQLRYLETRTFQGVEVLLNGQVHGTTRRIPAKHYDQAVGARRLAGLMREASPKQLLPMLCAQPAVRQQDGLHVNGYRYLSEALGSVRLGAELMTYSDEYRPETILVAAPNHRGELIALPAAEWYGPHNPPPTGWDWKQREAEWRRELEEDGRRMQEERGARKRLTEVMQAGEEMGEASAEAVMQALETCRDDPAKPRILLPAGSPAPSRPTKEPKEPRPQAASQTRGLSVAEYLRQGGQGLRRGPGTTFR